MNKKWILIWQYDFIFFSTNPSVESSYRVRQYVKKYDKILIRNPCKEKNTW